MKTLLRSCLGGLLAVLLADAALADGSPRMIRIYLEYIEVPHEILKREMEGPQRKAGARLHARLRELVKKKEARVVESCITMARPGQKAIVESIREFIYPTEYEPSGFFVPRSPPVDPPRFFRPAPPVAFETRNVGVTLEIEPNVGEDGSTIDLRFAPEIVAFLRLETWHEHVDRWGDASARYPVFADMRVSTGVTLKEGRFALIGSLTPTRATGGAVEDRKLLMFVRADLVFVEPPED